MTLLGVHMNIANTLVSNACNPSASITSTNDLLANLQLTEIKRLDMTVLSLIGGGEHLVCW
jgi:hypothetical protein